MMTQDLRGWVDYFNHNPPQKVAMLSFQARQKKDDLKVVSGDFGRWRRPVATGTTSRTKRRLARQLVVCQLGADPWPCSLLTV